jgi:(p)ppGpp synthase/HD superfamily hydrolase
MATKTTPRPLILAPDAARLGQALAFAAEHHGRQARKGTTVPYVSHLLHVAGLVLEYGGSVDQAIAALLHDLVEDSAAVSDAMIRDRFGARVAAIVTACTDTFEGDTPERKSPWKERKRAYLEHLAEADDAAVLVSACDKRHNLGALVGDLRRHGPSYMERFNSSPAEQLWFYEQFVDRVGERIPAQLAEELRALVAQLRQLIAASQ